MVPDMADRIMSLEKADFASLWLSTLSTSWASEAVSRRVVFPLRQRHAKYYVKPGIALVGDAAHTIHPLAGQGANIGLLDVAVLADELLKATDLGIPWEMKSYSSDTSDVV